MQSTYQCQSVCATAATNSLWPLSLCPGISECEAARRRRCSRPGPAVHSWKSSYIRQHRIESNWRNGDEREPMVAVHAHTHPTDSHCQRGRNESSFGFFSPPKVLRGHDDHVITCLQFSGDLIVSGSDDNTLKVWSAVTGKVRRCGRVGKSQNKPQKIKDGVVLHNMLWRHRLMIN